MVAIEHRVKSTPATTTAATAAIDITTITTSDNNNINNNNNYNSSSSSGSNNNSSSNNNNLNNNNNILTVSEAVLSPVTPTSPISTSTTTSSTTASYEKPDKHHLKSSSVLKMSGKVAASTDVKDKKADVDVKPNKTSATSQRSVDIKIAAKSQELTKRGLKLELKKSQDLDDYSLKSPKSPISARLPHQTSLTSSVDVEDRKTLREALYQGIFSRHRRTIFAFGSFLRMLRSRTSQYNTIRSSSEGEDVDEVR